MKRWFVVSCLAAISALGVLVPAGAQASTLAATKLTSGKPVKATVSKPGQELHYTFAATENKNVTFDVTHFNFTSGGGAGTVYLYFYEPGSSSVYTDCGFSSNSWCNFTAPVGGTWRVTLIPSGDSVGSLTLTFANNVPTKALTSGTPVSTTIKFEGQEAGYTFAATKNKNVTFDVTHFNFTSNGGTGTVYLYFYEPGSSSVYTDCGFSSNSWCNFTAPVGGTWRVTLIPSGDSVGSLTLTFANNVPTRTLTLHKPVSTTIKFEGQEAGYTFAATKNKNVTFDVTHFNFTSNGGTGTVYLYFYEPGSSSVYTDCGFSSNSSCNFPTPVGGTWRVTLIPSGDSVGSLTLELT